MAEMGKSADGKLAQAVTAHISHYMISRDTIESWNGSLDASKAFIAYN